MTVTEPELISILTEDRSSSFTPLIVIEFDVPSESGAKYIVVVLSKLDPTISTLSAVSNEFFVKPAGIDSALIIILS